jgi:hypothetical protein
MKKYFKLILSLSMVALLFAGCEETRMEKAQDYDFDKIDPIISGLTGTQLVVAGGIAAERYEINARTGSVYTWAVIGHPAVITEIEGYNQYIDILFEQTSVAVEDVLITVYETTIGGLVSDPDTLIVDLDPFCPMDVELFVGDYAGTLSWHADVITMEATGVPNEVRVYELGEFIQVSWGENWTAGDGSCLLQFVCDDKVMIPFQWIGDTDYPDVYVIEGAGTVDYDKKEITLTYEIWWGGGPDDGGSANAGTTVLTLQ